MTTSLYVHHTTARSLFRERFWPSMARHRRGLLGSTNLATQPRDCDNAQPGVGGSLRHSDASQEPTASSPGRRRRPAGAAAGEKQNAGEKQKAGGRDGAAPGDAERSAAGRIARRDKFRLPLISDAGSFSGASIASSIGSCCSPTESLSAEAQLARNIDAYERKSKSFKDEHWYKSPVGFGSKKSVLLVALRQLDPNATGRIQRRDAEAALAGAMFNLQPQQVRELLTECSGDGDATFDYAQFVKKLRLPTEPVDQDPLIYRQQNYIEKVRARSQTLIRQVLELPSASTDECDKKSSSLLPLISPVQTNISGPRRDGIGGCTNGIPPSNSVSTEAKPQSVLPPLISPLRTNPEPSSPEVDPEIDRLSFEYDKQRKQRRAEAKAQALMAHITRMEEFTRREQQQSENHDKMRLAVKALHRQDHFERAFEEENRVLQMAQRQGKGMLHSEYSHLQRNVSKDSMFYVVPV